MPASQILKPLHEGTLRIAKLFLKENPDILQKYVDTGMTCISLAMVPVNAFMKHLLEVQGLDPNTTPGEKARRELQEVLDAMIEQHHGRDFDDDYEFAPFYQKYQNARKKLIGLTKDKFKKLTDLANLPGGFKNPTTPAFVDRYPTINTEDEFFEHTTELNRVAPEAPKKELPLDRKGRQALREKILKEAAKRIRDEVKYATVETTNPIDALREAVKAIETSVKLDAKKGIKTAKKKANKKPTKVIPVSKQVELPLDPKFKGMFRRVYTPIPKDD